MNLERWPPQGQSHQASERPSRSAGFGGDQDVGSVSIEPQQLKLLRGANRTVAAPIIVAAFRPCMPVGERAETEAPLAGLLREAAADLMSVTRAQSIEVVATLDPALTALPCNGVMVGLKI